MSRKFHKLYTEDAQWLLTQSPCVKTLWVEAAASADPFAYRWRTMMDTTLKETAFRKARKALEEHGLFQFRKIRDRRDARITVGWEVLNLREYSEGSLYQDFLASDYWQSVRQQVLARDSHRCQSCDTTRRLQVHHKTYENHGEEHLHLEDLVTLCSDCHQAVHGLAT